MSGHYSSHKVENSKVGNSHSIDASSRLCIAQVGVTVVHDHPSGTCHSNSKGIEDVLCMMKLYKVC